MRSGLLNDSVRMRCVESVLVGGSTDCIKQPGCRVGSAGTSQVKAWGLRPPFLLEVPFCVVLG